MWFGCYKLVCSGRLNQVTDLTNQKLSTACRFKLIFLVDSF